MGQLGLISKNIGLYTFANLLKAVIGFLLVPLYTYYLTPNDFGIVSVVSSLIGFFSIFYSLSLSSSIIRFFKEYSKTDVVKYISTIISFLLIFNVILTILLIVFKDLVIAPFIEGINFYPYIFVGLLTITLTPIFIITQTINQALHNAKKYSIINLIQYALNILMVLVSVMYFRMGAFGVLLSQLLSTFVFFCYSFIILFREYKFSIDRGILKNSLNYSLPLVPHSLSGWTLDLIDRVLLNNLKSTADVGIYNVGYKLGSILDFFISSVHLTMSPWFMENVAEEKGKKLIIRISEFLIYVYSFIALCICFFSKELFAILLSKEFRDANVILPYITFSYVIIGAYYFFGYPLFYDTKRTKLINIATFVSAALNVVLNLFLIPKYGMIGASAATLLSFFVSSLITLILSNKAKLIRYNYESMYLAIALSFSLALFVTNLNSAITLNTILLKLLTLTIILLGIVFKYRKEMKMAVDLVKSKLKK
jgi:O-antigen/teichoic acid export membrane protein